MTTQQFYDTVIVGAGVGGLYTALHLPTDENILIICKDDIDICDSMLAQGGICVLLDDDDYDSFMEDTMKAGHYENRRESVEIMVKGSRSVIDHLISLGVDFETNDDGSMKYTKEGAHSKARICFHQDITGREITTILQNHVLHLPNVTLMDHTTMTDLIVENNRCCGILAQNSKGETMELRAENTVLATGGIGGRYKHTTNYPDMTGDALVLAERYSIELEHPDYVQIHPTSLYRETPGRSFLISESARGEGAVLLNAKGERFVDELLPRDKVTEAIYAEMEKDETNYVWLSFDAIANDTIHSHFPNIYKTCLEAGFDITKEPIPVVPAQHYFMGGIHVDSNSKTTMEHLYAVGETSCNGVHGKNRLASNSLLESLVFAKRAAHHIADHKENDR